MGAADMKFSRSDYALSQPPWFKGRVLSIHTSIRSHEHEAFQRTGARTYGTRFREMGM